MDAITDLTREKERVFPFSPFLTQGLNQKREAFSSKMAIQNWDRMDSEELLIKWSPKSLS